MKKLFQLVNSNLERMSLFSAKKKLQNSLPIITISREMGSGGRPIALMVEKKLGKPWKLYHQEIVEEIARETKLQQALVREIDEKDLPFSEKIIDDIFGKRYLTLSNYYKHLLRVLSLISQRGYAIIMGRGANFLIKNSFNVRIICNMEKRIQSMMKFEKLSEKEAIRRIEKSDEQRKEFNKILFHHDPRKAHHYDLIIRTGDRLSLEDATETIVFLAKRRFGI